MRISGLHIDGFGIFRDRSITGLTPRLVLIQGDNEAGKSTLLGFIRAVLFGFPRANAKGELLYPPVAGGVHGGRIDIVVHSGEAYTLSRSPGKHGGLVSVENSLGLIGDGELLTRLLGGVTYEVFKNLFAFGLSELQSVDTLEGDGVTSAVYGAGFGTGILAVPRAQKVIQARMEALFKAGGTKPLVNAEIYELEKLKKTLLDAGARIHRYDQAVDEKQQVEDEIGLSVEKLDRHRHRRQALSAYGRLWPEWLSLQENESALSSLAPLITVFPEEGLSRLEKESEAIRRFEAEQAGLFEHREQLCAQMASLSVDTALLARAGAITELIEEKGACLEKTKQLPALVREKTALDTEIKTRLETLARHWSEADIPAIDSGWRESYVEHFDTSLVARHRVEVFSDRLTEAREAIRSAAFECREKAATLARVNEKLKEATTALIPADPLKPWLMGVPGIPAAIGSIWWHWCRPLSQASILAAVVILAYFLTLLHKIHTARGRQQFQTETIEKLTHEAGPCERSATEARSAETRAKAVLADELNAWRAQLKMLGLAETLPPSEAIGLFFTVEATAVALKRRSHRLEEIHRLETGLFVYRQGVRTLLQELNRPALRSEDSFPSIVDALAAQLEVSRGNEREKAALETQLHSLAQRITVVQRQLQFGRDNHRALLSEAGAETETDFRQKARVYAERLRLMEAIAASEKNLRRITGEYDVKAVKNCLRDLTLSEINAREKAEGEAVAEMELELDTLRNRRAELSREIAALSSDEDMATLRGEEARLLAELQALVFDWSRYALAGYLLDQARESFETAHQPHVIRDAGRFFEKFTGGRYTRLMAPMGEKALRAVTADNRSVSPEVLSRGTAEQLYLAVRFGFIRHRAKSSEPLPVVMDDILVNFDPERAQAAAAAIAELSRTHQVLFFTCHPETIGRFRNTNADVQVIHLKGR